MDFFFFFYPSLFSYTTACDLSSTEGERGSAGFRHVTLFCFYTTWKETQRKLADELRQRTYEPVRRFKCRGEELHTVGESIPVVGVSHKAEVRISWLGTRQRLFWVTFKSPVLFRIRNLLKMFVASRPAGSPREHKSLSFTFWPCFCCQSVQGNVCLSLRPTKGHFSAGSSSLVSEQEAVGCRDNLKDPHCAKLTSTIIRVSTASVNPPLNFLPFAET